MNVFKILIANRGEIANRIIRTAASMGVRTVAVFAKDDQYSLHVFNADESYPLGEGNISDTYLNISKIIQIAIAYGCDAIHPGYGFLSENVLFAEECKKQNIKFIGPNPTILKKLGDKAEARNTVKALGIPVLEGIECSVRDLLTKHTLEFPIIVKPVLGGGGKGMHIAHNRDELQESFRASSREAGNYFADSRVYFEHYIGKARHVEVQIAADNYGNVIHLFERECTIQRNFQKFIEEAPSPSVNDRLRTELTNAAIEIARATGYSNIGTVEFLLDEKDNWYFIEMNTRIQVEHPVTEAITGIDLVRLQLEIASGNPLPWSQDQICRTGHAIEVRINAEDPKINFKPSSGYISLFKIPSGCRFDTFISGEYLLPAQYDSLLGKLIVWNDNRSNALRQILQLLSDVHIHGPETNQQFLKSILESENFSLNNLWTNFTHEYLAVYAESIPYENFPWFVPVIAFVYLNFQKKSTNSDSIWNQIGYWRAVQETRVRYNGLVYSISFHEKKGKYLYRISGEEYEALVTDLHDNLITLSLNNVLYPVYYSYSGQRRCIIEINGRITFPESPSLLRYATIQIINSDAGDHALNNLILAPLHGRVTKINVTENTKINRGDVLLVIESMKTENNITAPRDGLVKSIYVTEGSQVKDNMLLIELDQ